MAGLVILIPARPALSQEAVTASQNAELLPCYDVFELTAKHDGIYDNNFFDVELAAVFTSPAGQQIRRSGFFYGGDEWKVRFRPDEPGHWTYTYDLMARNGFRGQGVGAFECTASDATGPVFRHPENPHRWVFANGQPYFPVGLQDCVAISGSQLMNMPIDGEQRTEASPEVSPEEYFALYGQAGFNLFRFSQNNCSYALFDNLDHYREAESIVTDQILSLASEHGFRVMFGFFGLYDDPGQGWWLFDNPTIMAKEKRFLDYAIARWGVYVDFWELLNESYTSDIWITLMANHVRSVDPDQKPITTSWDRPYLPAIDLVAPHWYESESEFQSDLRVVQQAAQWKQAGKPVIFGEQGNTGMNWDPLSGMRMRLRTWTALFQEISFIFWNTNWAKNGMFQGQYTPGGAANIYLGPAERGYIQVLQDFASRLDADVRMTSVDVSSPGQIRAYGLVSNTGGAAYLHHFANHTTPISEAQITLDLPPTPCRNGKLCAEWIEPATGNVLACLLISPGRQTLTVPSFTVDMALLVTSKPERLHPQCASKLALPAP